jgi:hypothetical protein
MKSKLLKKLRADGRDAVHVYKVVRTNGMVTGIGCGFSDERASELYDFWEFGEEPDDYIERVARAYMRNNIERYRKEYRKYSRKNKK